MTANSEESKGGSLDRLQLNAGDFAKIAIALVFVIGYTVTCYAWIYSIESKLDVFIAEQHIMHKQINECLIESKDAQEDIKKVQTDLTIAINRTSVLLEEISKKISEKPTAGLTN